MSVINVSCSIYMIDSSVSGRDDLSFVSSAVDRGIDRCF